MKKIKLAAIARDEAAYLPEWIFHHLDFGFDEIEIYINNTVDNSSAVLENITDNYPVKVINADKLFKKSSSNFQSLAYTEITKNALADGFTYLMLLDIDEFWTPADFKTSIKEAIRLFNYPQVINFNWFVHCDEEPFSTCFKNEIKIKTNAHVKTVFQLNGPWEKVRLHNVTGKDLVYTRGNGDSFDFGDSKLCGLSNAQCLTHDYFVIHRMYRSEMEYISLLGRGRANKSKIKNNRPGYYKSEEIDKLGNDYDVIEFSPDLLKDYYLRFDQFIQACSLAPIIAQSETFIKSRFDKVMGWAAKAKGSDADLFYKLFLNIQLPQVIDLRKVLYRKVVQNKLDQRVMIKHSWLYLIYSIATKLFHHLGLTRLTRKFAFYASKNAFDTNDKLLLDGAEIALKKISFPKQKYADFYREMAIYYYNQGELILACRFINEANKCRPNGPMIIKLHKLYNEES